MVVHILKTHETIFANKWTREGILVDNHCYISLYAEAINYLSQARDREKNLVSHYITSILHINIGKGNNILEHLINDMQAVYEFYTHEYVASHRDIETMSILLCESKELITNLLL